MTKQRPVTTTSRDPVTDYARKVVNGKIVAGPYVRAACARHLKDLLTSHERNIIFNRAVSQRAIDFFADELKLSTGKHEGMPFRLLDWQSFVIGSIFGWLNSTTKKRRFSKAYIETGKGSGKSPLLAGIAMYLLMADGEADAQIYFAATSLEQAKIPFRAAAAFHRQNPEIGSRLVANTQNGETVRLTYHQSPERKAYGFMTIISSDNNQSGPIPHGVMIDELHEWRDASLLNVLEAGAKGREQPLVVAITNSAKKRLGVCWDQHEYGRKVVEGILDDDTLFAYICANDLEKDGKTEIDPFDYPEEWKKTNPSLGQTIEPKYLQDMVRRARNIPSFEADVRRLNFCQWGFGENANPWISFDLWSSAGRNYTLSDLAGRRAYIGLDIAAVHDLTACVFLVEPDFQGEPWYLLPYFWLPRQNLRERTEKENIPWLKWAEMGHLQTCDGPVIDYAQMAKLIIEVASQFEIVGAGRDPAMKNACDREVMAADMSWPWIWEDVRQGYITMGPAIKEMERRLIATQIKIDHDDQGRVTGMVHPNHPILTMCVANAVIAKDSAENIKFEKAKSTGRIDGIVAAANSTSLTLTYQSDVVMADDIVFI